VDLWPTVSAMSWIGTPFLLMTDTGVCRPSWACQWPKVTFFEPGAYRIDTRLDPVGDPYVSTPAVGRNDRVSLMPLGGW
jgi:hypothetical protein